jgi:hypothetical protein
VTDGRRIKPGRRSRSLARAGRRGSKSAASATRPLPRRRHRAGEAEREPSSRAAAEVGSGQEGNRVRGMESEGGLRPRVGLGFRVRWVG